VSSLPRYVQVHAFLWRATAIAWAGLIFFLSTGGFGGSFTQWLLMQILDILHVHVSQASFATLHHLVRKCAHMTEYAIFAMLIYGSAAEPDPFRWRPRRALYSVLAAAVYSVGDEFHQMFVPGRGPSLWDCGIDTIGAALGVLLFWVRGRNQKEDAGNPPGLPASALEA
jgi:VanZ family protein